MALSKFGRCALVAVACLLLMTGAALAQSPVSVNPAPAPAAKIDGPPLPAPLQHLAEEGGQVRYLGRTAGLDGWIAVKGGKEQYFYVTQNGEAFVMGLLFDKTGKMVTLRQVSDLQGKAGDIDKLLSLDTAVAPAPATVKQAAKTPSEELLATLETSNWIPLGRPQAPVLYMFIDPQCPYCKAFMADLRKNYIDNGLVQARIIPVGLHDDTRAQAAFLLAASDPQKLWYRHLDGDAAALPVMPGINEQGVQRNLAIMQSWKFNVTPLAVYRARDGAVKIIQGRAKDVAALIADLPASAGGPAK